MSRPQNRWRIIPAGAMVAVVFAVLVANRSIAIGYATANAVENGTVDAIPQSDLDLTSESMSGDFTGIESSARRTVLPTGWRRTTRGWERAEAWAGSDDPAVDFESYDSKTYQRRFAAVGGAPPQTLSQWMVWDRAREPLWANKLLGGVRLVHPLFVAIFLITAAILITRLSERKLDEFRNV